MTLKPSRFPFRASLGGVSQDREMTSGDVAVAWTFSGGRLGTEGEEQGGEQENMRTEDCQENRRTIESTGLTTRGSTSDLH